MLLKQAARLGLSQDLNNPKVGGGTRLQQTRHHVDRAGRKGAGMNKMHRAPPEPGKRRADTRNLSIAPIPVPNAPHSGLGEVSVRSSGDDPCCPPVFPTPADALDAAVNGCPERAPRRLRNRAGVPKYRERGNRKLLHLM